jgi:hypothetical protein
VVIVSNQSYEDPTVNLTVCIDGTELLSQPFEVENQHMWWNFPTRVPLGRHVVRVMADTNAEPLRKQLTLPEKGRRYALVEYWEGGKKERPYFTWRLLAREPAFM